MRAHKAKLYKIEEKVVKINQAIHDVLRGLYFTYWYALSCVEPSLSWLERQKWPRALDLVSIVFGY